ncbi:MAG: hypothetical protein ACRD2D_02070, partial [Terriglobales bacterium]
MRFVRPGLTVLAALSGAAFAFAGPPKWVSVASPHFTVVSDGSTGQARDVAAQMERLRSALHDIIPGLQDPSQPVEILAVKKKEEFVQIVPEGLMGKGKPNYAVYTVSEQERNLFLVRLDTVADENNPYPYGILYKGYVNLMLEQGSTPMPDWLWDGLGEFYYTAQIRDHDAEVGRANPYDLDELHGSRLFSLGQMLSAKLTSDFWNQEGRRSLFDAESWAMVHMLLVGNGGKQANRLSLYVDALGKHQDAETAFSSAFGDLTTLQTRLDHYTGQLGYKFLIVQVATKADPKTYGETELTLAQAEALRAEYMIQCQRFAEARLLLEGALKREPNDIPAMESMGLLEWKQGNTVAARNWYARAAPLDPNSFLTQYRFAELSLQGDATAAAADPAVEAALRTAIKDDPKFPNAYAALAMVVSQTRSRLAEAVALERQAIALKPSDYSFHRNLASLLMSEGKFGDAAKAAQEARVYARTPQELADSDVMARSALNYQNETQQAERLKQEIKDRSAQLQAQQAAAEAAAASTTNPPAQAPPQPYIYTADPNPQPVPTGAARTISGKIQSVYCTGSNQLDLSLNQGGKVVVLHTDDYFKVAFAATNFTPKGPLLPCHDVQGLRAKVTYIPGHDPDVLGTIVSVVLS